MKKLNVIACALFCLCFLSSRAQDQLLHINQTPASKPKIFSDLPEKMNLKISGMDSLFALTVGSQVRSMAVDNFLVEGILVSKSDEMDKSLSSVVIRLTNRPGAVFSYSRRINSDGTVIYSGRIMSRNNGDAYELVQDKGLYSLQKKSMNDMMVE